MVWVGDLFEFLSPLEPLKLNEGVVRVAGFEPSITSIKSRVPYLSATRAYFLEANLGTAPSIKVLQTSALASWLVCHGTRGRIQTYDLPLRRRLLLFTELLGYMVGPLGFEPR